MAGYRAQSSTPLQKGKSASEWNSGPVSPNRQAGSSGTVRSRQADGNGARGQGGSGRLRPGGARHRMNAISPVSCDHRVPFAINGAIQGVTIVVQK